MDETIRQIIDNEVRKHQGKLRQFAIDVVDTTTELGKILASNGIWAGANIPKLAQAIAKGDSYIILFGFRPSRFHLGHLTLAKELQMHSELGASFACVVSGSASHQYMRKSEAVSKLEEFWQYVNISQPIESIAVYSDIDSELIQSLKTSVRGELRLRKVMQLYGWDLDVSIAEIEAAVSAVTTFLFLTTKNHVVVSLDINQATHAELTKIVAKKLNIEVPTFLYRSLLPSIIEKDARMSFKDLDGVIFLDEDATEITKKLRRAVTGGRATKDEQLELGGEPHHCSFFRISQTALSSKQLTDISEKCISGTTLCSQCKKTHIEPILKRIRS